MGREMIAFMLSCQNPELIERWSAAGSEGNEFSLPNRRVGS